MTPKQQRLLSASDEINNAFLVLQAYDIPCSHAFQAWRGMVEQAGRQPDEHDLAWPWEGGVSITSHLSEGSKVIRSSSGAVVKVGPMEERPVLSTQIEVGRAYSLTPAQRDVVRSWFNMTPAKLVEVLDIAFFPVSVANRSETVQSLIPRHIMHVVLRSVEHVEERRKHVINKFTIAPWGRFMHEVQVREAEILQAQELAKFTQRVEHLLVKAKKQGVEHRQRTAGTVAYQLHSEVEVRKLTTPEEVRELLRCILVSLGEHGLAKLVKEPKYFPDSGEKKNGVKKDPVKDITSLMSEYGV